MSLDDLKALEAELKATEQRIKKLEEHKKSVSNGIEEHKKSVSNGIEEQYSETTEETIRRLERNLNNLYEKRGFLIKERDSKFKS